MSISFRRPKKPVRPRVVMIGNDEEDEDMDDEQTVTVIEPVADVEISSPSVGNGSQNSHVTKSKSDKRGSSESSKKHSTLLSFDEELEGDDGEIFKVKKSSTSRRLMKQRDKEKKDSKTSTREQIKDNSLPGHSSTETQKKKFQLESYTTDIKITNSKNESSSPVLRILNGREAEAVHMESSDEEEEEENVRFRRPTASSAIQEELRRVLEQGQIPDAKLIHEARKRKQMARQQGGTEFIPVENVARYVFLVI